VYPDLASRALTSCRKMMFEKFPLMVGSFDACPKRGWLRGIRNANKSTVRVAVAISTVLIHHKRRQPVSSQAPCPYESGSYFSECIFGFPPFDPREHPVRKICFLPERTGPFYKYRDDRFLKKSPLFPFPQ